MKFERCADLNNENFCKPNFASLVFKLKTKEVNWDLKTGHI
jgi:hypothetical protein